jgi:hypothetical protein
MENVVAAMRILAQHTDSQCSSSSTTTSAAAAADKTFTFEGCATQGIQHWYLHQPITVLVSGACCIDCDRRLLVPCDTDIVKGNTQAILRLLRFIKSNFDTDAMMESSMFASRSSGSQSIVLNLLY